MLSAAPAGRATPDQLHAQSGKFLETLRAARRLSCAAIFVLLALAALDASAHAAELAGATLPDTLKAGEKVLKLNGLGLQHALEIRRPSRPRVGQAIPDAEEGRDQGLQDEAESTGAGGRLGMSSRNARENR